MEEAKTCSKCWGYLHFMEREDEDGELCSMCTIMQQWTRCFEGCANWRPAHEDQQGD